MKPRPEEEVAAGQAFREGIVNGFLTLVPTAGGVYVGMKQSAQFRALTSPKSRAALAFLPALLVFGFTSEERVLQRIKKESQRHDETHLAWVNAELAKTPTNVVDKVTEANEINRLYRQAISENVQLVPGHQLAAHQIMANYVAEKPYIVLGSLAIPGVALIYMGMPTIPSEPFSMKVLHTRVFGQFATLSVLLGVMGFSYLMDKNGIYTTEYQIEKRVDEMNKIRHEMLARNEHQLKIQDDFKKKIQRAHEEDVKAMAMSPKN